MSSKGRTTPPYCPVLDARLLAERLPDGVVLCEGDTLDAAVCVWQNAAARRAGIPPSGERQPMSEVLPQLLADVRPASVWRHAIASNNPATLPRLVRMGESVFDLELVPLGAGRMALLFKDATAREQAVAARGELEIRMMHAQRLSALGRFAGSVAHSFNNALTAISAYTSFVSDALGEDHAAQEDIQTIVDATKTASQLSAQLASTCTEFNEGDEPIEVNRMLESLLGVARNLIREDVHIDATFSPGAGHALANRERVESLLLCLFAHCQDRMRTGGGLTLETRAVHVDAAHAEQASLEEGHYVLVTVTDDGPGVVANGSTRSIDVELAQRIAREENGRLAIYSEPERGSVFRLYLPQSCAEDYAKPQARPRRQHGNGEMVLVVEDDDLVRRVAARTLRNHGYQVVEAASPSEGLALAERQAGVIDCVLTDLVMPGIGGATLAGQVQQMRPQIGVVFMSGYPRSVLYARGAIVPGGVFLSKPFARDELLGAVAESLEAAEARARDEPGLPELTTPATS